MHTIEERLALLEKRELELTALVNRLQSQVGLKDVAEFKEAVFRRSRRDLYVLYPNHFIAMDSDGEIYAYVSEPAYDGAAGQWSQDVPFTWVDSFSNASDYDCKQCIFKLEVVL